MMAERMRVAQLLWKADISAEYPHQDNPKFKKQLDDALERGIPFMVVFGSEELAKGVVKVKDMRLHTEVEVRREDLVAALQQQGCGAVGTEADFLQALRASNATAAEPETTA
jgi:histidyl-tRNA synthetase